MQQFYGLNPEKSMLSHFYSRCHTHGEIIEYYCETCEEIACETCFFEGPHNTPVHLGRAITEIKHERISKIRSNLNKKFRERESDLLEKQRMLDRTYLQITYLSNAIKDRSVLLMQNMLDETRIEYSKHLAIINKCHGELQADIGRISHIIRLVNSVGSRDTAVSFLRLFPTLDKQTEFLLKKKYSCTCNNL